MLCTTYICNFDKKKMVETKNWDLNEKITELSQRLKLEKSSIEEPKRMWCQCQ